MMLSSCLKHCESSLGSCDECSTAPGGCPPLDQADGLSHKPAGRGGEGGSQNNTEGRCRRDRVWEEVSSLSILGKAHNDDLTDVKQAIRAIHAV